MNFSRIFWVNVRSRKIFKFLKSSKFLWNFLSEILKIFLGHTLTSKIAKKSRSFLMKIYTSVNFFRIFGANMRFLTSKHVFFLLFYLKCSLALKILKKFPEVNFFTSKNHELFQNFWTQCVSKKNLWNFRYIIAIVDKKILRKIRIFQKFRDFSDAQNDSKKSEKIHDNF